jgi:type IV pilus assembly protein PilA
MPAQAKSMLNFALAQMPKTDLPLVSVRTNMDDGILMRSYLNRSLKQDIATISIYNPVTVGLMAAMAIPAFQKVRVASEEKAVLNNLRMLAAAADQYYLENNTMTATYDQLVGPSKYIPVVTPVAGENYRALRFKQGTPLRVRLGNGKFVELPQ